LTAALGAATLGFALPVLDVLMPVLNRIAEFHDEITAWRRDFHSHPEILFDVERTAGKVEALLAEFGIDEIVTGLGRTGGGGDHQRAQQ
jgi:metal-dependent amidase/aminoacylase/carboxypeptidase family protein